MYRLGTVGYEVEKINQRDVARVMDAVDEYPAHLQSSCIPHVIDRAALDKENSILK